MNRVYTQLEPGQQWLKRYRGKSSALACILGFTDTCLIPGISAAGLTPDDRRYTAVADAEFLCRGVQARSEYPLPPLVAGASPVLISRAIVEALNLPLYLFDAGLPVQPSVPAIALRGVPAKCLTSGAALPLATVNHLLERGLYWGQKLAAEVADGYLILGECVVGGTTTALAVLTGLGIPAADKVNSSHPSCNHEQKWAVVQQGLRTAGWEDVLAPSLTPSPLHLIAAVGDPMQVVVAGMAIAASRRVGVLLAGGTQMLAVYALMQALVRQYSWDWQPENIVVGTTRWVAEDPTGDTVGLAAVIERVPLIATQLSFANSRYPQLRVYERGYVKEGVAAGGCAIAAHLYQDWSQERILEAIEDLFTISKSRRN
jgi:uncharacterized protein (TIGR00303 family)